MKYISVITNIGTKHDHRDAAVVGGELPQNPRRGSSVSLDGSYPVWGAVLCLMTDRNVSFSDVHPASSLSRAGLVRSIRWSSRISNRSPQ